MDFWDGVLIVLKDQSAVKLQGEKSRRAEGGNQKVQNM